MKHLRLLPLLIAAAFYLPRAQAAALVQHESNTYGAALICIGLVALAAAAHRRRKPAFKHLN